MDRCHSQPFSFLSNTHIHTHTHTLSLSLSHIYNFANLMQSAVFHSHIPVGEMTCQAKLRRDSVFASLTALLTQVFLTSSSLFFNPYHKIQLASGDYEGCVCLWDVNKTIKIVNNQEHSKRVWSVVYNPAEPSMYASGSDDCTGKVLSHCPSLSSHSPSLPPQ